MKYWIYKENAVKGPFDRAQMKQLAGFDEDTLVCPEGRRGTEMGDWQRASSMPELAPLFSSSIATTFRGGEDSGLRDVVNQLKNRISGLERTMERIERETQERSEGFLEDKEARARIGELESRINSLDAIEREIKSLREKLEVLESKPAAPALMSKPEFSTFESKPESPALMNRPEFPALESKSESAALENKSEFPTLESKPESTVMEKGPASTTAPSAQPTVPETKNVNVAPSKFTIPEALEFEMAVAPATSAEPAQMTDLTLPRDASPAADPFSLMALASEKTPAEARHPITASRAPAAFKDVPGVPQAEKVELSKKKKFLIFMGVVCFALLMVLVLYFAGRPVESTPEQVPSPAPAPELKMPAAPVKPPEEAPAADLSQEAVDMVKKYQVAGDPRPLDVKLRVAYPQAYSPTGELSPWMVEKLGLEKYQVSFYLGTRPVYVFLVQPKLPLVQGVNSAAVALLEGNPIQSQKPIAKKKRRRTSAKKRVHHADSGSGDVGIIPTSKAQNPADVTLDQILNTPTSDAAPASSKGQ